MPLLVLIIAVGAILRLYGLDNQSLWRDEANTIHYASRETIAETIRWLISSDVHPPLYDILFHGWIALFGESIHALRGLSALFGICSIWLIYRLGRSLCDVRVGLLAATLQSVSLMQLYYSQEARSYAMLSALAIASMDGFVRWLRERSRLTATCYTLATLALIYTHTFGLFIPLVQSVYLLLRLSVRRLGGEPRSAPPDAGQTKRLLAGWLGLQAVTLLLYAPWIPALLGQARSEAKAWIAEPLAGAIPQTLLMFLSIAKPPWSYPAPDWTNMLIVFIGMTPLLVGASIYFARRSRAVTPEPEGPSGVTMLALTWLILPIATAWLISKTPMRIYTFRNLIICAPALYILLAAGLARVRPLICRVALLAGLISFSFGNLPWYYASIHKEDWRGAERFIQTSFRDTDQLVLVEKGPRSWLPSTYYLNLAGLASRYPVTVDLEREDPVGERIWTLGFRPKAYDKRLLERGYRPLATREFYDGVTVVLYGRRDS
ncbi:MAG TPA: glycosyltransferase family 39 protein [Candidatus Polarisedimenticolia bacterium]|jgi:uncharacterized membrane protein